MREKENERKGMREKGNERERERLKEFKLRM